MKRLPDWERRLMAHLNEERRRPFAWGSADCLGFAAGAVEAQTGERPGRAFAGRYRTERGARGVIARAGGLVAAVRSVLGDELPNPLLAHRGDVVVYRAEGEDGGRGAESLGVREAHFILAKSEDGTRPLPLAFVTHAWRISF